MSGQGEEGRPASAGADSDTLADIVASSDTGARNVPGGIGRSLALVALAWSLFQLWIASPLPFLVSSILPGSWVLNDTESRSIHLAFAIFLAFTSFPALRRSPRDRVPPLDWLLALLGAFAAAYLYLFYDALADRPGLPTWYDLVVSGIGMVILLEATRRALGPPLMIVALVFLAYVFFGHSPFFPDVIRWGGASFQKAMSHLYLGTEGVFGVALGVSSSFVFLFVLFGALLDRGGAGNYFIQIAFALLGHLRGGPAKAAVLASAMTGLISGSSIANVVTTGTFTIPLMKRVGFSAEKAGAVEVASSVNGQIMPPVMGAAAFLMVEYIGIPYVQVIKHAFLPATISYIALLYLVHLEALRTGMQALPKPASDTPARQRLLRMGIILSSLFVVLGLAYYVMLGLKSLLPELSGLAAGLLLLAVYLLLLRQAAASPDLAMDDPESELVKLPVAGEVAKTGLHYVLPIVVLVWFLMVERKSPGLSAFWATLLMIVILLTQRPAKVLLRGAYSALGEETRRGFGELVEGLISGARNMIGIAVATAAAGIIVGTVTLTGIGQVMAEFVEFVSGGNLMLILILTAVISLVLGMGLPTTANYIVVSSLMAPVVVELGAQAGLILPLVAVHMFVFYFGIMADVTPPVGLASFAAAAVSGGDPMRTGFTAFFYSLRTVILPFLFVFNTNLLLIDVGFFGAVFVFIKATVAMLIFAAATQGYFFARSRYWESAALLLVAFTLFRPGFWLDQVEDPFDHLPPAQVAEVAGSLPAHGELRIVLAGPDFDKPDTRLQKTLLLDLGEPGPGAERLERVGLLTLPEGEEMAIEEPFPGTPLFDELQGFDFYGDEPVHIVTVMLPAERMPREVFYIPALLLLGLVIVLQRRRATVPAF